MLPPVHEPLFLTLMGRSLDRLPDAVRALHLHGTNTYSGCVVVRQGQGWLSRLCCWIARLPAAYSGSIAVDIQSSTEGEVWERRFGTHRMRSSLSLDRGQLHERLGPLRFWFRLTVIDQQLAWSVERVRLLVIPLPIAWFGQVTAVEGADDGRYTFNVSASLPWIGLLVHYQGWLDVD